MRTRFVPFTGAAALAILLALPASAEIDWGGVNRALGRNGAEQPGGVHRYSFPRSDLKVTVDGIEVKPGLALGGWLAFHPTRDNNAMVVGDLVLLQEEIPAVTKQLLEGGIDVTAIHNHLLRAEPFPMYVHVEGEGDTLKLAGALQDALALTKIPVPAAPTAAMNPGFDAEVIASTLGRKGQFDGDIYKYNIARAEPIRAGHTAQMLGAAHGTGIVLNFQSVGGGRVASTGDFVLAASEVGPAMKSLRDNNIEVTALHSHMLDEEPRLAFLHFWAVGAPEQVARGLRAALDHVALQQAAAN